MHPTGHLERRRRSLAAAGAVALFLTVLASASSARAQTGQDKLARGLAGMTTGFLEVPGNMVQETREEGPAGGIPLGLAKGLGMVVIRELVGVYEFVSAPFPAPEGYRPIIQPEYPWNYFDEGRSKVSSGQDSPAPANRPS